MATPVSLIVMDVNGTPLTIQTDDDHLQMFQSGLAFNDGTDDTYYFQPWSRIIRIVSQHGLIGYK